MRPAALNEELVLTQERGRHVGRCACPPEGGAARLLTLEDHSRLEEELALAMPRVTSPCPPVRGTKTKYSVSSFYRQHSYVARPFGAERFVLSTPLIARGRSCVLVHQIFINSLLRKTDVRVSYCTSSCARFK